MRSSTEIKKIADGIFATITSNVDGLVQSKQPMVEKLKQTGVDEGLAIAINIIADIETTIKSAEVDYVHLPAFLSKVTVFGETIDSVRISIRAKQKAPYKYAKKATFVVDDNFVKNVVDFYIDALFEMFYIEEAVTNITVLNEKIASIIAENEIPFSFKFDVDTSTDAIVLNITDKEVIFNADLACSQDIPKLAIFYTGDAYNELVAEEAVKKLVNGLKGIQTTTQLIKSKIKLISTITGRTTKRRATKLIRETYHRKAKNLNQIKKNGVGYYEGKTEIDGEEVQVFALVGKDLEGNLGVVLSPFDTKTLFNVDFDVIAAVEAEMAEQE